MKENYQKKMDAVVASLPEGEKPRLLLQSCCGPCSSYVLEALTPHFRVTVLYYNPNIQPREEYDRRLETQRQIIAALPTPTPVQRLNALLMNLWGRKCSPRPTPPPSWLLPP